MIFVSLNFPIVIKESLYNTKLLFDYRLFAPDTNANEEIENLDNLSSLDISMHLTQAEDPLEVIFLDIEGNLSKEQQRCLDLFQELPDFWQDFLQR